MTSCVLAVLQNLYKIVNPEVTETIIVAETDEQANESTYTMNQTVWERPRVFWAMMVPAITPVTKHTVNPAMPAIATVGFVVTKVKVKTPHAEIVTLLCSPIVVLYKRNKMLVFFFLLLHCCCQLVLIVSQKFVRRLIESFFSLCRDVHSFIFLS